MAKTNTTSVHRYIASQPAAVRAVLNRVRGMIRKALPDAEEGIAYIPVRLIAGIARFRAEEAAGRGKANAAGPKKVRA